MRLILASSSIRKRYILENIGFNILVNIPKAKEPIRTHLNLKAAALEISWRKAYAVASLYYQKFSKVFYPILSTNTIFIYKNNIIKPPGLRQQMESWLLTFSGKTYKIITTFTIIWHKYIVNQTIVTNILLKKLNKQMINYYICNQIWYKNNIGVNIYEQPAILIERINGNYSNILGLPIRNIINALLEIGYLK